MAGVWGKRKKRKRKRRIKIKTKETQYHISKLYDKKSKLNM